MNDIPLSGREKTLYMLVAYLFGNNTLDDDTLMGIAKELMPESTVRISLKSLKNKGLVLSSDSRYYYYNIYYQLAPGRLFPALRMLTSVDNADDLTAISKAVAKARGVYVTPAVRYAMRLFDPTDNPAVGSYPSSETFAFEIESIAFDRNYHNVLLRLPDSLLKSVMESRLNKAITCDEAVDWDYLRRVIVDERKRPNSKYMNWELFTCFNLYHYLATGRTCFDIESLPVDRFSLATAAIMLLYKGDYEQSGKLFAKAMTLHNKVGAEKGVFDNFIINYLYALSLLLLDNDTAHKKFDSLVKKRRINSTPIGEILIVPLHIYFHDHRAPVINESGIQKFIAESPAEAVKWLAWMICKRLDIWPSSIGEPSLTAHQPRAAYLRAELLPTGMVPTSDEAPKLLGTSLFYRLKVKAVWEMRLEEIINENTPKEGNGKDDRDSRLIYLLEYSLIVPILQKRKKDGGWSVGRRLAANSLKHLDENEVALDDTDRAFIRGIDEWDYNIYQSSNLKNLVSCDHVFTGDQSSPVPVRVHEDKPFLIINKAKDGSFTVSTNVEELKADNVAAVICKMNSDTDYSIYKPTALERKVYRQILTQEKYPREAEPLLMKLIATLGGKTEIHSNMVVDFDDLERVDGETRLTLRCAPDRYDTYSISVSVHAFPGLIFVPGAGNVMTIAEKDGRKVQVVRHLKTERKNMRQLSLKLADLGVIDEGDEWEPQTIAETLQMGIGAFLELMQWAKDNATVCEMEWPEGARIKYHPALKASAANIGFRAKNGWFDVEGDVRISEDEVISLQKLLELMRDAGRQKYIKIGNDEYISLSSDLGKILRRLDTVTSERRNHLQMSSVAAGLIGDILDNPDAKVTGGKALETLRQRIADSAKIEPKIPATLKATMRDYQVEGYEWMERVTAWGAGVCLADDMGLGKTLQTIAFLLDKESDGASLVVAPASVVPNWRNELQRFAPTLNITVLNDAEDRTEAIREAKEGDIVVSTYALLNIQQEQLAGKEWNIICLDEAHTIKNPNTKMSKAAMSLQAKRKVILTGTPIQNHLSELWNLFQFINPGLLGSSEQFARKFIEPIEGRHDKERQNQLRRLISPFLLRRTKGEVIEELPEKNEITIPVELSSDEMTMYEVRRRQAEKSVLADKNVKVSTLAEITKLREMACSVSLVDKKWKKPSSKVLAFIDLAESLNDSGNRALVFSQFTSFFDQIRTAMDKAKLPYLYLDGSTPMAQREKLVKDFQTGKCPFFLISLKAGGLGLNLTGANYVIHLDPWWNPAIEQQATDRAYRIGQKQNVTVYHLIAQHTIEEKILRLHKSKRDLADSLLQGSDMSHALTQEELLELLS